MVLAWENNRSFLWCRSSFCCCCYSSFVDVVHSHFLFDIIPHPSVDYRQVFRPILYFQPSPSQSDLRHFHFQPFRYLLTASATVLSGHFLPTGVFYLTLLPGNFATSQHFRHIPDILTQPFFYQGFTGSWQLLFVKVAGLHTDPQNTDLIHLFVWFTVIHNLLYILTLYLCMSILQKFYLWWKLW